MLRLDEPIPTPAGWTTVGDLRAGSAVLDDQGRPTRVLGFSAIDDKPAAYRLTFDDGSTIEACAGHRWLTFDAKELSARASRVTGNKSQKFTGALTCRNMVCTPPANPPPTGTVRTTADIVATLRTATGRTNHAMPVAEPLDLPHADLPIDPYLLGLWLGDGHTAHGRITTAKHIPPAYLRASREQRLALLQGLMDTDGTVTDGGSPEFTTTCERLARGVHELILTMGWKARIIEGRATLYGRDIGPQFDIKWMPNLIVFRLSRKAERQRLASRRATRFRYVVDAEPVPGTPMRCLKVDSTRGLFLAGRNFLVTHNSDWLLMEALRFVEVPGYNALLLRRTFADLNKPEALIPRSKEWLMGTDAKWNEQQHVWTFPKGSTISFGYCDTENDIYQYQGAAYQMVGFDELTQFMLRMYLYLFSRLRKPASGPASRLPIRMRSASNPGGISHTDVKARFIDHAKPGRLFIPSKLEDNPYLDAASYVQSLSNLDPVTRAQLLAGDWSVRPPGSVFRREWFGTPIDAIARAGVLKRIRFWDLAASESETAKYTAGVRMAVTNEGKTWVEHVLRFRKTPGKRDAIIVQTAATDPEGTEIWIEQEPGSGGIAQIDTLKRSLYKHSAHEAKVSGDKGTRAGPFSSHVEAGHIVLSKGGWNEEYLGELEAFQVPVKTDHIVDQVDASSGAYNTIAAWLEEQHIDFDKPPREEGWEEVRSERDDPQDPLAGYRVRAP